MCYKHFQKLLTSFVKRFLKNQPATAKLLTESRMVKCSTSHKRRGHNQPNLNQSLSQIITSVTRGWCSDHDVEYQSADDVIGVAMVPLAMILFALLSVSRKFIIAASKYLGHINGA